MIPPQSQSSIAVSLDGVSWAVLNASPDIRDQIQRQPLLHPARARHTPISTVLVTNAEVDHIAGLLTLRESQPFDLMMTKSVSDLIEQNPIFRVLSSCVSRRTIEAEQSFPLLEGVEARLFEVDGKEPLFMEGMKRDGDNIDQTVGIEILAAGQRAYYIPGCRTITPDLKNRIAGADILFFDGTNFHDDDLIRLGVGSKTAKRMGHVSMAGPDGSLEALADLDAGQKVFIHINNTNPVWQSGPERDQVLQAGWEIAYDGMEVSLGL